MNTNQLKYFIAIADRKSMKKAAEELYITHQCISTSMKRLEEELGTTLFERTSQGVSLNENGFEVYKMAEKILQEIDSTTKKLTDINNCEKIVLRIMISFGMSELLFNNVIKTFRKNHPNVSLLIQKRVRRRQLRIFVLENAILFILAYQRYIINPLKNLFV